jgi:hypothetical protein
MNETASLIAVILGFGFTVTGLYAGRRVGLLPSSFEIPAPGIVQDALSDAGDVVGDVIMKPVKSQITGQYLSADDVYALAQTVKNRFDFKPSAEMLTTVASIESSFNSKAYRYEKHLDDASYGLMQTLYTTARWLHDEMGYNRVSLPNQTFLYDPYVSMYFGAAYLDWLIKAYGGTDEQIIRRYNGGPKGDQRSTTLNHWIKYQNRFAQLNKSIGWFTV